MRRPPGKRARWLLVVVFAVAMAWVEAASVYYLRAMVDRIEPYQPKVTGTYPDQSAAF